MIYWRKKLFSRKKKWTNITSHLNKRIYIFFKIIPYNKIEWIPIIS